MSNTVARQSGDSYPAGVSATEITVDPSGELLRVMPSPGRRSASFQQQREEIFLVAVRAWSSGAAAYQRALAPVVAHVAALTKSENEP